MLHSNREPGSGAENEKVGVLSSVGPVGPPSIAVSGGLVSTVKARSAGEASTFPDASVARTRKVCAPSPSGAVVCGAPQAANAPPSTLHSNVEPASLDERLNVGVESFVCPSGPPVISVLGGVVSTRLPEGENAVRKERVTEPWPGTTMFQLSPIPLSTSVSQRHVFVYPPSGGLAALLKLPSNHCDPGLTGTNPSIRAGGELFGLAEQ